MTLDDADPKGLIRESYRIDGITGGECRSIFLDWALSLPVNADEGASVRYLLGIYGAESDSHPMTETLKAALESKPSPRRRGGRRARVDGA